MAEDLESGFKVMPVNLYVRTPQLTCVSRTQA